MTIKEVEKTLNISRANIRFYEKEGLLEPKRSDNEYRNYSSDDIKRLECIILFRKCNVSIENIRLIFSGKRNIDEVFKEQMSIIDNEVKELAGARVMCKKLSQEKSSINNIDVDKYMNDIKEEELKGNKFNNITEDYIFATEKLYQSIIESIEVKGESMKRGIKILIYFLTFVLLFLCFIGLDYLIYKNIDFVLALVLSTVITGFDIIYGKKYNNGNNKNNIKYIVIYIFIIIITVVGIYLIRNKNSINDNILDMSIKNSIIDIANKKIDNNDGNIYAESHKILDYEIKNNKIYVYIVTNYGLFDKNNCDSLENIKESLTLIYNKNINKNGIYDLLEYKEYSIPSRLNKDSNVNYNDLYFRKQLDNYCNIKK